MLLTDDKSRSSRSYPSRANMISAMKWLVEGAQMHDSLFLHCTFLPPSWIPSSTSGRWMCSCPLLYFAQIQAMVSTVVRIRSGSRIDDVPGGQKRDFNDDEADGYDESRSCHTLDFLSVNFACSYISCRPRRSRRHHRRCTYPALRGWLALRLTHSTLNISAGDAQDPRRSSPCRMPANSKSPLYVLDLLILSSSQALFDVSDPVDLKVRPADWLCRVAIREQCLVCSFFVVPR